MPPAIFKRMMAGELTPRQATAEARETAEARSEFNARLRREAGVTGEVRPSEIQKREYLERQLAPDRPPFEGTALAAPGSNGIGDARRPDDSEALRDALGRFAKPRHGW